MNDERARGPWWARSPPARRLAAAAGIALLLGSGAVAGGEPQGDAILPPVECVERLRAARIAGMTGDPQAEREQIEAALADFPRSLAPLYALIDHHRRHPPPPEEKAKLLALLAERLRDPETPVPFGVLAKMARDPEAELETLELVAETLERQQREARARGDQPDGDRLRLIAGLQERVGRPEDALETLRGLWALEPEPELVLPLALLLDRFGRYREAVELLAPYATDDRPHLVYLYARALGAAGDFDQLLALIERFEARPSDGPRTAWQDEQHRNLLRRAAWELHDAGRGEEAERLFRRLVELAPDNDEARAALLYFYASDGDRREQQQAMAASWEEVRDPNALLQEGIRRLAAGDSAGAVELLEKAVPQFPELEAGWFNLGIAATQVEDWDLAAAALERAAALNGERVDTHLNRGLALFHAQRYAEAIASLERALELDPGRSTAHYYLGNAHRALGNAAAAERHLAAYRAAQ